MKNQENFDDPVGKFLGRLDARLTNLHGLVTGPLFSDRAMRMCGNWEELEEEFGGIE